MIPLLSKNFWYQNISERQNGSPTMFSAIWDKKISKEKRDTPFLSIFFSVLENFWNTKAFSTKFFGTVRLKLFDGKSLNSYFMQKVFGWHSFYESLKGSPQKIQHRETKKFKKVVIVCCPKFFRYQKISELQGSSYKIFWYCETKTINKIVIPYYLKTFDTRAILKHRRVRPRCFSAIWDKKVRRKNVTPPFLSINFFRTRTFLKDKRVPPRSFSVLWD